MLGNIYAKVLGNGIWTSLGGTIFVPITFTYRRNEKRKHFCGLFKKSLDM